MRKPIAIIPYSLGEEIFSAVTHGVGAALGVAGTAVLIVMAALHAGALAVVSCSVYGATMIILYTMSTLYHSITPDKAKRFFRIMDHDTIFLLIAGTYTPYSLIGLRGAAGWALFGVIWGFAVLGIVFNSINLEKYKIPSMICYIMMGWAVLFTMRPLVQNISTFALVFLVLGGVAYTGGIFFYARNKVKYFHSIWHIFVLLGTVLHYFSVLDIVMGY